MAFAAATTRIVIFWNEPLEGPGGVQVKGKNLLGNQKMSVQLSLAGNLSGRSMGLGQVFLPRIIFLQSLLGGGLETTMEHWLVICQISSRQLTGGRSPFKSPRREEELSPRQ